MNGWLVALLVVIGGGIYLTWQSERIDRLNADLDRSHSLIESLAAQTENNKKYDNIDRELRDGGEDALDGYLADSARKLWP